MAVKSILDIELRDQAFKQFAATYQKYQDHLKLAPKEWAKVTQEIGKSKAAFDGLVKQEIASLATAKLRLQARREAERLTSDEVRSWDRIAKSSKEFASNIATATRLALRWTAFTGALGGLVGAGSLFGIDRLSSSVSAGRRNALGLGTTYGAPQAFGVNFGRLVDGGSFLSAVADAKLDVNQRTGLLGAGLSASQIKGDTAGVGVALLRQLKIIADNSNPQTYAQIIQARHLGAFVGPQDLQRLRSTSREEFEQLIRGYSRSASRFGLDDATARKWQDFTTQLSDAGRVIETVLVKGLTPLAPALTKLSESVAKTIATLLANPRLKEWIDDLGKGVQTAASYLTSDEFQMGARKFTDAVIAIGNAAGSFASWLTHDKTENKGKRIFSNKPLLNLGPLGTIDPQVSKGGLLDKIFMPQKISSNDLLGMVRRLEGSGDNAVSPAGAIGRYQILPGTARQYGFDPSRLRDPAYNKTVAQTILADLIRKYQGNTDEVLAAYNAGPGRANRFRAAGDNSSTLPAETQAYINRAHGMSGYGSRVSVDINNNAGGAVNVTANQIAQ